MNKVYIKVVPELYFYHQDVGGGNSWVGFCLMAKSPIFMSAHGK